MDELYRSDNIVVRRVSMPDQGRWVITFDNYGIGPGFDRAGFGEEFLKQSGISAIHVMGRGNDWYQYPDVIEAMAVVRSAVAGAEKIMTYGSSMGGYAALRFANVINATAVLALSPQYSLDPAKVSHDGRWAQDAQRIRWMPEVDTAWPIGVKPVIVYDPSSLDGWHGRRIADETATFAIRLRHTAHPVTTFLSEIGLLKLLVLETLDGTLDARGFEMTARQRRNVSGTYLGELAMLQPAHRTALALALARRAVEAAPGSGHAIICLSRLLTRRGDHQEAVALLSDLVDSNRFVTHLIHYADALSAAGSHAEACELAREVLVDSPKAAHLWGWAGFVFWTAGRHGEAREAVKMAVQLAPSNGHYRKLLTNYRFAEPDATKSGGVRLPPWVRLFRWFIRAQGTVQLGHTSSTSRTISGS